MNYYLVHERFENLYSLQDGENYLIKSPNIFVRWLENKRLLSFYISEKPLSAIIKFIDGRVIVQNGFFHSRVKPAVELSNGIKKWYINGELHREDGPAIEGINVTKSWWINGQRHRIDGPAIEYGGYKEWYYQGKHIDCQSQEEFERIINLLAFG